MIASSKLQASKLELQLQASKIIFNRFPLRLKVLHDSREILPRHPSTRQKASKRPKTESKKLKQKAKSGLEVTEIRIQIKKKNEIGLGGDRNSSSIFLKRKKQKTKSGLDVTEIRI